jgi:hypothetical protein
MEEDFPFHSTRKVVNEPFTLWKTKEVLVRLILVLQLWSSCPSSFEVFIVRGLREIESSLCHDISDEEKEPHSNT